mgnify:CR=1 FL=1
MGKQYNRIVLVCSFSVERHNLVIITQPNASALGARIVCSGGFGEFDSHGFGNSGMRTKMDMDIAGQGAIYTVAAATIFSLIDILEGAVGRFLVELKEL